MIDRRFFAELAAIVAAAVLCAGIANFVASRERKLALIGTYTSALEVSERTIEKPVAPSDRESSGEWPAIPAPTAALAGPVATATTTPSPTSPLPGGPAAVPKIVAAPPPAPKNFPPHPEKMIVEITGDDAVGLWRQKALFLDARRSADFAMEHIPGARSFAVWESDVDDKVRALGGEGLDLAAPIVVYCTGGECEDSHMLAEKLFHAGFTNALVYRDGLPDWQKRGMPEAKGAPK